MLTGKFSAKIDNYRPDIDGLRAVAVLLVLGYHVFPEIVKGGFIGVDIFFVISGYLISGIILDGLKEGTFTFRGFFARRIKRIFPALTLILLVSYVLGWFILMPKEFRELCKHILGGAGFAANFTLWHDSGYFDVLPELKPLLHLWSLGIEEQFYLLWPLGLFLAWKFRIRLLPFILMGVVLSFLLNIFFIRKYPEGVFYFPLTRFWELLIGAANAFYLRNYPGTLSKEKENFLSAAGFALIALATLFLNKHSFFPGWWAILPTFGALFLIIGQKSWVNSQILSSRLMVWVGLISYPLYLWHWLIISFVFFGIGELPFKLDRALILSLSFLLAWITYRFYESPIRHGKNTKQIVGGLLAFSCVIGGIAFLTLRADGFAFRMEKKLLNMPEELREMLKPDFGGLISSEWREHTCFLAKGETPEKFQPECSESGKKPMIFVWGDSHAAALYSGLKSFQKKKDFGISQYNASACPPVMNWNGNINKLCSEINSFTMKRIREIKPDIIILQASWSWSEYNLNGLEDTLAELKKLGIPKIILTGQAPAWKERVPANINSYYKIFGRIPPMYTDFGLSDKEEVLKTDKFLRALSLKFHTEFISIYQTLCDGHGCMLSTGNSCKNVTSLDQGHLSVSAAEFVIEKSKDVIFGDGK